MKQLGRLGLTATLWMGGALVLSPLIWAFAQTVSDGAAPWSAYAAALRLAPLLRYAANSLLIASLTAAGQTTTGMLAAYAFARLHFPGRDALFLLFLATLLLPPQITLLPTFLLLRYLRLIDSYASLVVPSLVHPFTIFLLRQSLLELSSELEDAACVDGCSRLSVLWHVALPHAMPALVASLLFGFQWSWGSFTLPLVVLQTPSRYTLPLGLAMLSSEFSNNQASQLAGALLATLPMAILIFVAQHSMFSGAAIGGTAES